MRVSEPQRLAALVDRLLERFPTASADEIRALVEVERSRLEGSRVRDYIPFFIGDDVRHHLRALGFDDQRSVEVQATQLRRRRRGERRWPRWKLQLELIGPSMVGALRLAR